MIYSCGDAQLRESCRGGGKEQLDVGVSNEGDVSVDKFGMNSVEREECEGKASCVVFFLRVLHNNG
jgi:hypothetical protein